MTPKQQLDQAKAAYEIARRNWIDKGAEFLPVYLAALSEYTTAGLKLWESEQGNQQ